jgi:L-fuculose-phosphate aldolase
MIKMTVVNGELIIPKGLKPSGELHMHWNIQKHALKTQAVLHVHPTHVIAAMYAGWELPMLAEQFPELGRYTSVAPNVGVLPVTSVVLGDVTYEHLIGLGYPPPPNGKMFYDIVGQDRHGICAVAGDPWSAYEHVERLDHVCQIVLASGVKPK